MAGLFVILFWWQKHIEQAGYFARIYQDTIESNETTRLVAPINTKWVNGEYIAEIILERSERGRDWIVKNKRPLAKDYQLSEEDIDFDRDLGYQVREIERSMKMIHPGILPDTGYGAAWGTAPQGVTSSLSFNSGAMTESEQKEKYYPRANLSV
jgi:hypothetical protein